jgi:hypothetical protein
VSRVLREDFSLIVSPTHHDDTNYFQKKVICFSAQMADNRKENTQLFPTFRTLKNEFLRETENAILCDCWFNYLSLKLLHEKWDFVC